MVPYSSSLNAQCVDLQLVPTYDNYPIVLTHRLDGTITEFNVIETYSCLGLQIHAEVLEINLPPSGKFSIYNPGRVWNLKLFSGCHDILIKETKRHFDYITLEHTGDFWQISQKGLANVTEPPFVVKKVVCENTWGESYIPLLFCYGLFNFLDIEELYSLEVPQEVFYRYSNNRLIYQHPTPIFSKNINFQSHFNGTHSLYPNLKVYTFLFNGQNAILHENLRIAYDSKTQYDLPKEPNGALKFFRLKCINAETHEIDYISLSSDDLVIYNKTREKYMNQTLDYVIHNSRVIPTISGEIFYKDSLIITHLAQSS